jgi:hypothetical protein
VLICSEGERETNLRNTLLVHTSVQRSPGYSAGVLALQEEGLGFAILEAEDLAVTADVELALFHQTVSHCFLPMIL